MTDLKIKKLYERILKSYSKRLDELLSICESPIEKLMMLKFYDYFDSFHIEGTSRTLEGAYGEKYKLKKFKDIELFSDCIDPFDPSLPKEERDYFLEKVKRLNYRYVDQCYQKIIGFKTEESYSESVPIDQILSDNLFPIVYRKVEIYPQREIAINGRTYRIDIAIFIVRSNGDWMGKEGEIISTKKIGIECNGYQYHSSPEQQSKFEERKRNLEKTGWHVISYSGSEIFRNEDMDKMFKEIIDIVFSK